MRGNGERGTGNGFGIFFLLTSTSGYKKKSNVMVFASILILFLSVKSSLLRVPAHRKITILANLRTEDPKKSTGFTFGLTKLFGI
jgi:hypothetical protein